MKTQTGSLPDAKVLPQLRSTEDPAAGFLNKATLGVYTVNQEQKITYWNKDAEQMTGYQSEAVLGRSCAQDILVHVDEMGNLLCNSNCPLKAVLADGKERKILAYMKHRDGYRIPVIVRGLPIHLEDKVVGAIEIFEDLTAVIQADEKISELSMEAYFDHLTKLPNRRHLELILDKFWAEYQRDKIPFGAIIVDIDNFKEINDIHGHLFGDKAIRSVASKLKACLRHDDFLGRWGGDEFLILLQNINLEILEIVSKKLVAALNSSSIKSGDQKIPVSISCGASMVENNRHKSALVGRADLALYEAKGGGKGQYVISRSASDNLTFNMVGL